MTAEQPKERVIGPLLAPEEIDIGGGLFSALGPEHAERGQYIVNEYGDDAIVIGLEDENILSHGSCAGSYFRPCSLSVRLLNIFLNNPDHIVRELDLSPGMRLAAHRTKLSSKLDLETEVIERFSVVGEAFLRLGPKVCFVDKRAELTSDHLQMLAGRKIRPTTAAKEQPAEAEEVLPEPAKLEPGPSPRLSTEEVYKMRRFSSVERRKPGLPRLQTVQGQLFARIVNIDEVNDKTSRAFPDPERLNVIEFLSDGNRTLINGQPLEPGVFAADIFNRLVYDYSDGMLAVTKLLEGRDESSYPKIINFLRRLTVAKTVAFQGGPDVDRATLLPARFVDDRKVTG